MEIFRISIGVTLSSIYQHKQGFHIIKESIRAVSIFKHNDGLTAITHCALFGRSLVFSIFEVGRLNCRKNLLVGNVVTVQHFFLAISNRNPKISTSKPEKLVGGRMPRNFNDYPNQKRLVALASIVL
jgi:hypothetical protein